MSPTFRALIRVVFGARTPLRMLDGFVDSVVQMFENCRPGLADESVSRGDAAVADFFAALYAKERPRLDEVVALAYAHLSEGERRELVDKIDSRVREVVIPAYARVAGRFTAGERNDFYLSRGAWHGAERAAFAVGGMVLGGFIVWAPFIPLFAKEWILVFSLLGLVFPDVRRLVSLKRYESELNTIVTRADDEIFRMDLSLLTREPAHAEAGAVPTRPHEPEAAPMPPRERQGGR
jgi:hypothetical protein